MTSTDSQAADHSALIRSLAVLCEKPGPETARIACLLGLDPPDPMEHTELFVHQLPAYASIYLDPSGKIGGGARDCIAGFWQAVGVPPPAEPDHLAALLGLWATLIEATAGQREPARRALGDHSQRALVWEHLASWLIAYLLRVTSLAREPYATWSELLMTTIDRALEDHLAMSALPSHLVIDHPTPHDRDDLISYLLAPVRSGIIITRADLTRAAAGRRLGIRIGERAFALKSLLSQDPGHVVGWIASEAQRQAKELELVSGFRDLTLTWAKRARRTASMLAAEAALLPHA